MNKQYGGTKNSKRKQFFNPIVSANKAAKIVCDKCEQTFRDNYNLRRHIQRIH